MLFSWRKRTPPAALARKPSARPRLESLEERAVPSASANTVAATEDFTTPSGLPVEVSFQLDQFGNAWEFNSAVTAAGPFRISTNATGEWNSIAATFGSDGNPVLFAVNEADGTLWEHNFAFGDALGEAALDANWREISNGHFLEISATTDATVVNGAVTGIQPVVYGIILSPFTASDRTVWEHNAEFSGRPEGVLNANWSEVSSGQFEHIAAAEAFLPTLTQNSNVPGVPADPRTLLPANPVLFGITANSNVWEHNGNPGTGSVGQPEMTTDANWLLISTGAFLDLTAVLTPTVTTGATPTLGPAHPVAYGIVFDTNNLWEHNTDVGGFPEGNTNNNWALISSGSFFEISAALDIQAATMTTPLTADPVVFGTVAGSHNLWEHDAAIGTGGAFDVNANWASLSSGDIEEFSGALHPITSGTSLTGGDAPSVFAVPEDFNLWEHPFGTMVNLNWTQLSTLTTFAIEPGPSQDPGLPGT